MRPRSASLRRLFIGLHVLDILYYTFIRSNVVGDIHRLVLENETSVGSIEDIVKYFPGDVLYRRRQR